jgi:hypothetical protein
MAKKSKVETCVYCAKRPAAAPDHVFARKFFVVAERDNLPQVPACSRCSAEKADLEQHLTAVILGGSRANGRGAKNGSNGHASQIPFDPEKLNALFHMIAKGLAWYHWHVSIDGGARAWSGILNAKGEEVFDLLQSGNARTRVDESLGNGTVMYVGAQGESPSTCVWSFSIYGGDGSDAQEVVSKIGVLIGSREIIKQFETMLYGGTVRRWLAGFIGLQPA